MKEGVRQAGEDKGKAGKRKKSRERTASRSAFYKPRVKGGVTTRIALPYWATTVIAPPCQAPGAGSTPTPTPHDPRASPPVLPCSGDWTMVVSVLRVHSGHPR